MVYCAIMQKYTTRWFLRRIHMANNDKNNKNGKGRSNLRGILTLVMWAVVLANM